MCAGCVNKSGVCRCAVVLEPVKTLVLRYNTSVVNCVVKLRLVSVSTFTVMQVQILVITIAVNTSKM